MPSVGNAAQVQIPKVTIIHRAERYFGKRQGRRLQESTAAALSRHGGNQAPVRIAGSFEDPHLEDIGRHRRRKF